MSSQPIKQIQLGLKESKRPSGNDNKGFKGWSGGKVKPLASHSDWAGTVSGKHKHTYKAGE